MIKPRFPRDLEELSHWVWAWVVLCLPVTSFRYFPFLGKDTMVRPLLFYPLAVLILVLLIRLIRRELRIHLNGSLFLFGLFLAVALVGTLVGGAFNPIPMHGQEFWGRTIRAWITLIGGLAFFIATMTMNRTEEDLRWTLKWLYAGLALSLVWSAVQLFSFITGIPGRAALSKVQLLFSTRQLVIKERVTGFAYEPSWLANQLATIYIPWLFAAVLSGYRAFKNRWIEPVLLVGAAGMLLLTYSRGGLVMAVAACGLVFVLTRRDLFKKAGKWFILPLKRGQTSKQQVKNILMRIGTIVSLAAILIGAAWILSQSAYFSKIWRSNKTNIVDYMVDIYAGPRLAYATAGWNIFQEYPWTGVGLGATGLYLYDQLPEWSKNLSEIARQLTANAWLYPNNKNMFIRILAETGLLGFGLYLLYLLSILWQILSWLRKPGKLEQYLGITGLTTWLVLIIFNFTQDSFIDPNGWFNLGVFLAVSASLTAKRKSDQPVKKLIS